MSHLLAGFFTVWSAFYLSKMAEFGQDCFQIGVKTTRRFEIVEMGAQAVVFRVVPEPKSERKLA